MNLQDPTASYVSKHCQPHHLKPYTSMSVLGGLPRRLRRA